jgi:hypothetical protein
MMVIPETCRAHLIGYKLFLSWITIISYYISIIINRHDIAEILLIVRLNTINPNRSIIFLLITMADGFKKHHVMCSVILFIPLILLNKFKIQYFPFSGISLNVYKSCTYIYNLYIYCL